MLNENIKTIRKSKGLSQEELAAKLNVVRQTVSRLEFRRPGNCGFRHCLSCVRVAVCPIRADSFRRFARRGFYDAKEVVTSESAASVCIDLFAGLCYNIYGI